MPRIFTHVQYKNKNQSPLLYPRAYPRYASFRRIALACLAIVALAAAMAMDASAPALAETNDKQYASVEMVAETGMISPGRPFWVAIRQSIAPGWHTYWKNPGDSGQPTTITWSLPNGFKAGPIQWPVPETLAAGPLMNFGYSGEAVYLVRITPPDDLARDRVFTLEADIKWLVCKDICLPEAAEKILRVASAPAALPAGYNPRPDLFTRARAALPEAATWPAELRAGQSVHRLILQPGERIITSLKRAEDVRFFPEIWGLIDNAAPQELEITDSQTAVLKLKPGERAADIVQSFEGVVAVKHPDGVVEGYSIDAGRVDKSTLLSLAKQGAAPDRNSVPTQVQKQKDTILPLWQALLFAVLGGIILNLMPCVFPVLSMKALSLAQMSDKTNMKAFAHGLSYTAGIEVCFAIIAGALIALKEAGAQIGWGFQFQNPVIVLALAYLFFTLALNLAGFFELKIPFSSRGDRLARKGGVTGSFFTGILATLVATPCTAPFMGAAMGYALTQSAGTAMAVFLALGFGLALPYLLLSSFPPARMLLPRPGRWMEIFRQFLAFPMFASSAWLVWVLAQQSGNMGLIYAFTGAISIAFIFWIGRVMPDRGPGRAFSYLGLLVAAGLFLATLIYLPGHVKTPDRHPDQAPAMQTQAGTIDNPVKFTPERLDQSLATGRPVFVNMTAAWCVTCKVNERVALDTAKTRQLFSEHDVIYVVGDWTNKNPDITDYLQKFGRNGVPIYVYYAPAGQNPAERPAPVVLPQLLTHSILEKTVRAPNFIK